MRLLIAAVGRLKDRGEIELVNRYAERIAAAGRSVSLGPLATAEIPESRAGTAAQRADDEAGRLLSAARQADRLVLLDETGRTFSSSAFADWLGKMRDEGARELAFLIGGPDGHGIATRQASHTTLSLSQMTLPHALARAVLAEQLYRAVTILSGHPYHRA